MSEKISLDSSEYVYIFLHITNILVSIYYIKKRLVQILSLQIL